MSKINRGATSVRGGGKLDLLLAKSQERLEEARQKTPPVSARGGVAAPTFARGVAAPSSRMLGEAVLPTATVRAAPAAAAAAVELPEPPAPADIPLWFSCPPGDFSRHFILKNRSSYMEHLPLQVCCVTYNGMQINNRPTDGWLLST
jgi:hypothetical protein